MKRFTAFAGFAIFFAGIVFLASRSLGQPRASHPMATYSHGALRVELPFSAPRSGAGNLEIEVLDPEDRAVGTLNRRVTVSTGGGLPDQSIAIADGLSAADLAWHRLRYRFAFEGDSHSALEGITAISQILRHPVVHVLAQQSYLAGSSAGVRVIVSETDNETPVTSGSLRIELAPSGQKPQLLYTGVLNERGTTRADFRFPAGVTGTVPVAYTVDTDLGTTVFTEDVRLEKKTSVLLTTEKPVYQPGQTIHLRALALDRSNHQAIGEHAITFEAEDAKGNKVFRKVTQTDSYGVAAAEFTLAEEVNFGAYHLRALMDDGDSPKTAADIAVQVERYVLPRFKVDLDFGGNQPKHGYRPGDHVTGVVRSNYFFGKPVDHAEVSVTASSKDVELFQAGQSKGTTDAEGAYRFDIRLPDFFAGHPLSQGAALVSLEAAVKDGAGHTESHDQTITVSESPLIVTAVPEGGAMAPGLTNQVYLVTSYPDGTPAKADLRISSSGTRDQSLATDASGIAIAQLPGSTRNIRVDAKDSEGNHASIPLQLDMRMGAEQLLLHTDQALYRFGERIQLQLLSTKSHGSAYVDAIKDGQTMGTWDIDIENGRAELDVPVTAGMAGTVAFHAYLFGRDGSPIGDRRTVFVQPAEELKIEATADAAVYRPGTEARIGFHVTNSNGEGVQAALGVEVVDQAVFALAEKRPGFAKVFFYLEQEAMKPRYEIHSIGLPDVIVPASRDDGRQDRAARALFSAIAMPVENPPQEFGRNQLLAKAAVYQTRYKERLTAQINGIDEPASAATVCSIATAQQVLARSGLTDAWGNALRADQAGWRRFIVLSAGPDGQFGNQDDIAVDLDTPWCSMSGYSSSVVLRVEHDRGRLDGFGDVTGAVVDSANAPVANTVIRLTERANGRTHQVRTDREGRFSITTLTTGRYTFEAQSPGFKIARTEFVLGDRDLAILQTTLQVGNVAETAEVTAEAAPMQMMMAAGRGGGGGGGRGGASRAFAMDGVMSAPAAAAPRAMKDAANPAQPADDTHVRSWFPESLFVAPEIITDRNGRASITIPIADSITTWRMAMLASTKQGALGTGSSSLKVFQDFFTEMDLPVTLTQGDEVSIPVAIYNYTGSRGNVRLRLDQADWFSSGADAPEKTIAIETGRVGSSQFTVSAKRIGKYKLTLRADMAGAAKRADIVVREIEVVPNGREQTVAFNGRLDSSIRRAVDFPQTAIPDSGTIFVRLYPGPLSQVVEGMDSLLRMPGGCFEQTSSSTYPNILALDYMKHTKKATPEVSAKAEGFIAAGYQRLLTFEVAGGGFSWFGNAPANKILTAYGLMEFNDMSKVHDVDSRVIQRTQQWLASRQNADGSWSPDSSFINEGATNRFNTDILRITAYVAWALQTTGYQGPAVDKAKRFIETRLRGSSKPDAYTLAVLANFAVDQGADHNSDSAFTDDVIRELLAAKTEQGDNVWWSAEQTSMYATGASASVETTGLAVQALLKQGGDSSVAMKALNYISSKKDAAGTWGSTQATIMALRALLLSEEKGGATAKGTVDVLLNGAAVGHLTLNAENNDLLHQFVLPAHSQRDNAVEIRFEGEGSMAYQVAGRYFVPWENTPARDPLPIEVQYDRTTLAQNQMATATATVRNNMVTTANMVMVDLGVPPGFDLMTEDLDNYKSKPTGRNGGRLEKYSLTSTQAVLYFDSIPANGKFSLSYRLRAKYPVRARTFESRVYEYYAPDVRSVAAPVELVVR